MLVSTVVSGGGKFRYHRCVTALGADIQAARQRAYDALAKVEFEGMHYRKDIGVAQAARRA